MPKLEGVYLERPGALLPCGHAAHSDEKLGLLDAFDVRLPALPKEERDIPGVSRGPQHGSRLPVSGRRAAAETTGASLMGNHTRRAVRDKKDVQD